MTTKEKSIIILHAHNTFNNGSFTMLINFIIQLQKKIPEDTFLSIWIELDGDENRQRFQEALKEIIKNTHNLKIDYLPFKIIAYQEGSLFKKLSILYKKMFCHQRFFIEKGVSSIIILGGDEISEYYKRWIIVEDLFRIYLYSLKFTTILAGQSIGPFKGINRLIASFCLSRSIIYSRDSICTDYVLRKLRHKPSLTFESADLAFPDLPNQTGIEALRKYNLTPNQYICIAPGGFYSLYTRNRQSYLLTWQYFISELTSYAPIKDKQLIFLPHVTRPTDDRAIISDFKKVFQNRLKSLYINDELMPDELRQILGNGFMTITSRLHVAISAFQMCKPAVTIGFSTKYAGVIGRSIKCPELTINSIEVLFEKPEIFTHEVMRAVKYVAENYNDIVYKLTKRIPELKKMAIDQVSSIASTIFQD